VPESTFVYSIYIAASAQTVWKALLDGEFTRQYWGHVNVSDWQSGSSWEHRKADATGKVAIVGEVIEAQAPHRLVITWADPADRGRKDRRSRVTVADMVRLTVTHEHLEAGSDMERKIASGWPRVFSSLKSLLETGRPLQTWAGR
jgi:uncharacterized protein YndB with AHSA1/START domain